MTNQYRLDKLKPARVQDTGYRYYSQKQLDHFWGLKHENQLIDMLTNSEIDKIVVLRKYEMKKIKKGGENRC